MKIKILIAYHKRSTLFKDDVLTPIHVGRAIANKNGPDYQWLLDNMIGDDTGDNISSKNASYNELTALYWAWKNYDKLGNPDYIGLMHYRRHLIFNPDDKSIVKNINKIKDDYFDVIQYTKEHLENLLTKYDFIYNRGHVNSVYEQYKNHHRIEDLDLAIKILKRKHPSYSATANKYMKKSYGCFANMFILPKKEFFKYCEFIFSIISEFESKVDLTNRRLFISERLTGIFIEKLSKKMKALPLSSTFICEKLVCHLASIYNPEETYQTSVLMNSIIKNNTYSDILINYHLLNSHPNVNKDCFKTFENERFVVDWVDYDGDKYSEELLPGHLGAILPASIAKVLFLDNRTVVNGSLDIILEACNTFEFMTVHSNNIEGNIYCFNTKLLRLNNVSEKLLNYNGNLLSYFKNNFPHETKSMADWVLLDITNATDGAGLYPKKRRSLQEFDNNVYERCMLHYEKGLEPWSNYRCAYNIYWWEKAEQTQIENQRLILNADKVSDEFGKLNIEFLHNYEQQVEQDKKIEYYRKKLFVRVFNKSVSLLKRAAKKILRRGEK